MLRLTGGRTIPADRETVWRALHDVTCLRLCIPGCSQLVQTSETRFDLVVVLRMGPVSVPCTGTLEAVERRYPHSLRLEASGQGVLGGAAAGTTWLSLAEVPGGCNLSYVVEARPVGPFAFAGLFLARGVAQTLVDRFATTFATLVGASHGSPAASARYDQLTRPAPTA